jgi:hypothetical protein
MSPLSALEQVLDTDKIKTPETLDLPADLIDTFRKVENRKELVKAAQDTFKDILPANKKLILEQAKKNIISEDLVKSSDGQWVISSPETTAGKERNSGMMAALYMYAIMNEMKDASGNLYTDTNASPDEMAKVYQTLKLEAMADNLTESIKEAKTTAVNDVTTAFAIYTLTDYADN